jgi:DNA-binding beta-propeller fold protein YncE
LHPSGQSAFVACEANQRLLQVDLETSQVLAVLPTGKGPDVLCIDPGLAWLYVAAESGDLSVFDLSRPVATLLGHDQPGAHSHSVAADATSHRVFFPLTSGPGARPALRIMRPTGT